MRKRDEKSGKFKSSLKPEDEAYIINNYQNMFDKEIAYQLKVNVQAIDRFRKKNGLYKKSISYEDTFGSDNKKKKEEVKESLNKKW